MNASSLVQKVWDFYRTFSAAFAGELVPQDPNDEPASVLLARIRAERAKPGTNKQRRGEIVTKASR